MNKIGILTFHRADNYGAILQAHALQMIIEKNGYDVDIINYRSSSIEGPYVIQTVPNFNINFLKWCYHFIQNIYSIQNKSKKRNRCEEYRKIYLHETENVKSDKDRIMIQKKYDVIVTGSDQIWCKSITGGKDDWYCFKKNGNGCKVVSYAASVGNCNAFKKNFEDYKYDLKKYDKISVRENDVKEYLEKELKVEIPVVLDPTLLIEKEIWSKIADTSSVKLNKKYVFYYDVDQNPTSLKLAKKIAKEKNLELVHFSMKLKDIFLGRNMSFSGPNDFLKLIRDAEYIITSSFHATVFSIKFNKKFIAIPHPQSGQRVISLLNNLGLHNSIYIEDEDVYSKFDIDFDIIENLFKSYVKSSEEFLIDGLKGDID